MMTGVNDMLAEARKSLGWGEPAGGNPIHKWYAARNGHYFGNPTTPWCDMSITYWAYKSGNYTEVCPSGDRAYTVWHAGDFQRKGRWFPGTDANVRASRAGDIVFFDWDGTNTIAKVDHVGIVEKNLGGGRVQTIEGNTDNKCLRRVRTASSIAGYGRPAYKAATPKPVSAPSGSPILRTGSKGDHVKELQRALMKAGQKLPRYGADGDFGDETEVALKAFQRSVKITADGEYGPQSAKKLAEAIK